MAKRSYRFVNDHGGLFRMTEANYRRYLLAGTRTDRPADPEEYGVCIGDVLTVTKFTTTEFSDEHNHEARRTDKALAIVCPKCGAGAGKACLSLDKRWQAEKCRTLGILDNGWRKTPHPERVQLAKGQ